MSTRRLHHSRKCLDLHRELNFSILNGLVAAVEVEDDSDPVARSEPLAGKLRIRLVAGLRAVRSSTAVVVESTSV